MSPPLRNLLASTALYSLRISAFAQALLEQSDGSFRPLIAQAGGDPSALRQDLSKLIEKLPSLSTPTGDVNLSQELVRMLNLADKQAQQRGDEYISSELVLLAALEERG